MTAFLREFIVLLGDEMYLSWSFPSQKGRSRLHWIPTQFDFFLVEVDLHRDLELFSLLLSPLGYPLKFTNNNFENYNGQRR